MPGQNGESHEDVARKDAQKLGDGFRVLDENSQRRIYLNPDGEVFIKDLRSDTEMRVNLSRYPGDGLEFTTSSRVEPICFKNMIGWRIHNG